VNQGKELDIVRAARHKRDSILEIRTHPTIDFNEIKDLALTTPWQATCIVNWP
jgi:hypothetical protein